MSQSRGNPEQPPVHLAEFAALHTPALEADEVRFDGQIAALAGAISVVYTPPEQRGRGYAGSVTAAAADRIFAEGRTACLHADRRNPISNRCYARIGFRPHCEAWHYRRSSGNGRAA
jgi:RimJ/RimL family protein N-acetyltransferase